MKYTTQLPFGDHARLSAAVSQVLLSEGIELLELINGWQAGAGERVQHGSGQIARGAQVAPLKCIAELNDQGSRIVRVTLFNALFGGRITAVVLEPAIPLPDPFSVERPSLRWADAKKLGDLAPSELVLARLRRDPDMVERLRAAGTTRFWVDGPPHPDGRGMMITLEADEGFPMHFRAGGTARAPRAVRLDPAAVRPASALNSDAMPPTH